MPFLPLWVQVTVTVRKPLALPFLTNHATCPLLSAFCFGREIVASKGAPWDATHAALGTVLTFRLNAEFG